MSKERFMLPVVAVDGTGDNWRDAAVLNIKNRLFDLLADAESLGIVVTVELQPVEPLAMRNYVMRGHVRSAR